ncbi:MAG: alanine:cation symporter family protein [Flavobacteriales bacterium]|nr:alanine:cation symporter family protein [Flavobacteriales bacterium]
MSQVKRILSIFLVLLFVQLSVFAEEQKETNFSDKVNSLFEPAVDVMVKVIFWDPLHAIGIYDPIIYDEDGNVQVESHLPGLVSISEGDNKLEGFKTKFTKLKIGQQVVIGGNVYVIKNIVDDDSLVIDDNSVATFTEVAFGSPSMRPFPVVVLWLIFGAIFFTIKLKFINFRGVKHSIDLLRGKFDDPNEKAGKEELTRVQALSTALSGTVGLGNIASVAVAISIGGPGATFWMIVAGLLGMASKFTEVTLGVKYREVDEHGVIHGGPMYYLKSGLAKRNLGVLGKFLAVMFAVLLIGASLGGGNMFQANQAFAQLQNSFPALAGHGAEVGVILAIMVGVVIIGGVKSIARVTERIVPLMAGIYMLAALVIIFMNYDQIIPSIELIISNAFSAPALKGGVVGVLIIGFQRAAFSNEAGIGSSAIAHSAAKAKEPVSEGFVALIEPFIDTVLICTITAFVIIITGRYEGYELQGSELTSSAFGSAISWFPYLLTIAIFLFAFSTMISWSYYGLKAWTYIFGKSTRSEIIFKVIYLSMIVVGAASSLGVVLTFSDMMILSMAVPNIIGLLIMSSEVKEDLKSYLARIKSGEIKRFD